MKHYVGYLDNPNRRVEVDAVNYIAAQHQAAILLGTQNKPTKVLDKIQRVIYYECMVMEAIAMKNPEIPSTEQVEAPKAPIDDMRVIGVDTDGCVVCDANGERYNTGETPEQFGSMTPEELRACKPINESLVQFANDRDYTTTDLQNDPALRERLTAELAKEAGISHMTPEQQDAWWNGK